MKLTEQIKKNWKSTILILGSLVFGFIAIFLGGRLYVTRNVSISPNAPQSVPHAEAPTTCQGFSVTFPTPVSTSTPEASVTESPTASPTESPIAELSVTATPTETPTPTASPLACYGVCTTSAECDSGMQCIEVSGVNRCANPSCSTESDCSCTSATETPTPTPAPTTTTNSSTTTPLIACNSTCIVGGTSCANGMECLLVSGSYKCANPSCSSATSCSCTNSVPSPVANQLPHAGIGLPTTFIISLAAILILGSFLLI